MKEITTNQTKVQETELKFDNLNSVADTLDYIEAMSPRELKAQLVKIRAQTEIVNIYSYGSIHIAWIKTRAKIKRKGI